MICSGRDVQAGDYADLMACANDTPYDPLCIYTHGERSERRGVADPSCPPPTDEGGSTEDMVGRKSAQGCKRPAPRPARRRVRTMAADGGGNGDRRVDLMDVGAYLAHADSNGLVGAPAGMANYGRPLRLPFDADGDGRIDLFDWYALQTCYDRATTRCTYLFDTDASAAVDGPDLDAFRASAEPPYSGPPSKPWRRQLVASRYGNPFMWTGQHYDATTGQYHFWARTYSPRLGRWLQRDPLGYVDGASFYTYAKSCPTELVDRLGLKTDCANLPEVNRLQKKADHFRDLAEDAMADYQTYLGYASHFTEVASGFSLSGIIGTVGTVLSSLSAAFPNVRSYQIGLPRVQAAIVRAGFSAKFAKSLAGKASVLKAIGLATILTAEIAAGFGLLWNDVNNQAKALTSTFAFFAAGRVA